MNLVSTPTHLIQRHPWKAYVILFLVTVFILMSPQLWSTIGIEYVNPNTVYIDDISLQADDNLVLTESFNVTNCVITEWESNVVPQITSDYVHSTPYSAVFSEQQGSSSRIRHDIQINASWNRVNCSAWFMIPELVPKIDKFNRPTNDSTYIRLYSCYTRNEENCSLRKGEVEAGLFLHSFPNQTRTYVFLRIRHSDAIGESRFRTTHSTTLLNSSVTLTPYRWYHLALVANSSTNHAQLYLDNALVIQMPLNMTYFESFDQIAIR
jgi:hypothetical protein